MSKSPFKLIDSAVGTAFEAEFPLPHDDTPTPPNRLVIRIYLSENETEAELQVVSRTFNDVILASQSMKVEALGNLLYGFARLRTRTYLELV